MRATVTVTTCTPPSAPVPVAAPSTITSGQSSTITETRLAPGPSRTSGTRRQFGSRPPSDRRIDEQQLHHGQPDDNDSYWVHVTGQCAPVADSPAVTRYRRSVRSTDGVAPIPHRLLRFTTGTNEHISGECFSGTSPFTYQWYSGNSG